MSTLEIFLFAKGVYKDESEIDARSVLRTFKSVTSNVADGKNALATPTTSVTAATVIVVVATPTTLATIGSFLSPAVVSVYSIRSFSFTRVPGKLVFFAVIVLIPPDRALTVAIPALNLVD